MFTVLTPVHYPDAVEKSHCQISQTSRSDVCPCCLSVKNITFRYIWETHENILTAIKWKKALILFAQMLLSVMNF